MDNHRSTPSGASASGGVRAPRQRHRIAVVICPQHSLGSVGLVLDVFRIEGLRDLCFWAEDMVHFSGQGHIRLANDAAALLDLKYRFVNPELKAVSRGILETTRWIARDVIPFFDRKLKGVTSGDGMQPKHSVLSPFAPLVNQPSWEIVSA